MKLKKLTICNLASIEKAEIDFDNNPLSNSDVFLISGKTGAGKSTILDAICLALYSKTPRFENTEMDGHEGDEKTSLKLDDERQIMRRNTAESFSSLTFEGNNGVNYEAKWYVKRAHKKVTGAIQKTEWTLTNLDKNLVIKTKDEIRDIIRNEAAGLDFSQFCRTTMLAQGEFTKFLNSGDNDKAAILEKITGLDIYAKIGAKIYEQTNSKKAEYIEADNLVTNTTVMTDQEIADKQDEIAKLQADQQSLKAEAQTAQSKLSWIEGAENLKNKLADTESAMSEILKVTESIDFKEMETLCRQWTETIEARKWLNDCNSANSTLACQTEALKAAKQTCSELKGGELWLKNDAMKTEGSIVVLTEALEAEKDRKEIYGNAQTINGLLKTIKDGKANIADNAELQKSVESKIQNELIPNKEKAEELYSKAEADFKAKESELSAQEQTLDKSNLPQLRKDKELCNTTLSNIEHARDELKDLEKARMDHENKKMQIAEQEKAIADMKQEAEALKHQISAAEECEKTTRETLNRQSATANEWAQNMRSKLKVGDTCPVCGQTIEHELLSEEVLGDILAQAENAWKLADKKLRELKDTANRKNADISAMTSMLEKAKDEVENSSTLSSFEHDALLACRKCGISTLDDTTEGNLEALESKTKNLLGTISLKITKAEELEKKVNDIRKELEALRKRKDEARNNVESMNISIKDFEGKKNTYISLVENKRKEVSDAEDGVRRHLAGSSWSNDWNADIDAFVNELNSAAKMYADNEKSLESMKNALKEKKANMDNIAKAMGEVSALKPEWSDIQPGEAVEVKDLLNRSYNLGNAIKTAMDKQSEATSMAKDMESRLDAYYAKNSGMNTETLAQLDSHKQTEISAKNSEINKLNEQKISMSAILEQSRNDIAEHDALKPVFSEGDSAESLKDTLLQIDNQSKVLSEQIGAINQLLAQNDDNVKKLGSMIADRDNKKKVYEKWNYLNTLFGDATGNKFRKIAQSYVLSNLIHAANSYMRTLTDRYTLKVNPGTFVILLTDAYQSNETRAASTLSGGEGFLVSLALALALSDIGNRLSVDTLFIDEGFGTLSGEPLHNAINTLRTLHSKSGRHVGIISHVDELKERIPVQIQVIQEGNNSSSQVNIVS